MKICIIGAGPSGSYAAQLLAKAGHSVSVFEEHKEIGKPVQCTGIVTRDILDYVKPTKGIILNEINEAVIHGDKQSIKLDISEPNIVLDRAGFDRQIARSAAQAGAKFYLGSRIKRISKTNTPRGTAYILNSIINGKINSKIKADIVIGADGPLSKTARDLGLCKNKFLLKGRQVFVEHKSRRVDFFLGGGLGWIVPESKTIVRVGVAADGNTEQLLESLLRRTGLSGKKQFDLTGGLIPIFSPLKLRSANNAYLIGDAAGFVKATTGGGIVPGLKSAQICAESIQSGKNYDLLWWLKLGPELCAHRLVFRMLNKMPLQEIDSLLLAIKSGGGRELLQNQSRDRLATWGVKMAISKPSLIKFLKYLF